MTGAGAERPPVRPSPTEPALAGLLGRCRFPPPGTPVVCAVSGGADSSALLALAVAAGCPATAVHVHHGLHAEADDHASLVARTADRLGAGYTCRHVEVAPGPNLEARARAARLGALDPGTLTGHTADDQAETLLLALLRGAGGTGLAAMTPGPTRPILRLRGADTRALCAQLDIDVAVDPTNADPRFRRNRVRRELLPLLDDIAQRDTAPLLTRTADLLRADDELLERLAEGLDPTDAKALVDAPRPLAARAIRRWLTVDGYPPDAAAVDRVLDVAGGRWKACEVGRSRRIERRAGRLSLFPEDGPAR
jgi:tRNA(Ile)-lysidine synthase